MVSLYWGNLFGIRDYKAWKNERRLNKFLDLIVDTREHATEELVYPIQKVYHYSTGKHFSTKQLNLTSLPVIETIRLTHITQVSCKPLEFVPRNLNRT